MPSYIETIRARVGRRLIFLAFSSVALTDDKGRVLLQHRGDTGDWGLPGGALELGEDILTCARRELYEETGLHCGPLTLMGVYSEPEFTAAYPNGDRVQQYTLCFQAPLAGGSMHADGLETLELCFFAPEEIPYDQVPPWYRAMLADLRRGGGPHFHPPVVRTPTTPQIESVRAIIGHADYIGVGATAVTVREDGRLLIARRSDSGVWHFPGGFCNLGENAAAAVVREVCEETGLEVFPERILGIFSPSQSWQYPNGDRTQSVVTIFRCRLLGGEAHPDGLETTGVDWATPQEILNLPPHPFLTHLNRSILEHLDQGHFVC